MEMALFFLYILGAVAAIPTNARYLSGHSNPTAETVLMPDNTAVPKSGKEGHPTHEAENPSILKSEELNHEQSEEQDKTDSHEVGLMDQEDRDGDFIHSPTEGTLDHKEDTVDSQQEKLSETTDFPTAALSSFDNSNQQENITKDEESQEQPISDSHHQLNKSSTQNQDLTDEGDQEQDSAIPDGEEEEEEPGEVGHPNNNQEREEELSKEHSDSNREGDSNQSDVILEESNQPTQMSKMQDGFEHKNQEQEDNPNADVEEDTASLSRKHIQHTEWQSQEGKAGREVTGSQKDTDKKTISMEPTDSGTVMPRNHGADEDVGNDDSKHNANDDYFIPSQEFMEAERAHSLSYYLKYDDVTAHESKNENADTSEAKKAESPSTEDETSKEGSSGVPHSCVNFQCKRGHICQADQQGKPHCVCQDPETCPPAKILDQVCGTDNQTYASSCHLFATKCRLEGTKKGHQLQLDYFGACKSIPACTDFEVAQFPLRMRDWLKNILMQLYEPNPKHAGYLNEKQRSKVKKIYLDEKRLLAGDHPIELLLRDFKKNYHMYVYPVHWQFNELDQHPADRILTHSELAPLRASLVPMEHCITRFFEECDPNKDKHITLKEWGHCFGIKEENLLR
uniref:SPARC-like 1 n=1 Tax=Jaculus jaculus TaxID=51337 RepID=A0A8C5JV42_JACJA